MRLGNLPDGSTLHVKWRRHTPLEKGGEPVKNRSMCILQVTKDAAGDRGNAVTFIQTGHTIDGACWGDSWRERRYALFSKALAKAIPRESILMRTAAHILYWRAFGTSPIFFSALTAVRLRDWLIKEKLVHEECVALDAPLREDPLYKAAGMMPVDPEKKA